MISYTCSECGVEQNVEEIPARGTICFRCHVHGISFGFVGGGGYGRKVWNSNNIKSHYEEEKRGAAEAGVNLVPVGKRWV